MYRESGALSLWRGTDTVSSLSRAMVLVQRYDLWHLSGQYMDIYHDYDTKGPNISIVQKVTIDHVHWYVSR